MKTTLNYAPNIALGKAFIDNLNRMTWKNEAEYALQHLKLCNSFMMNHGVSMNYLANSLELFYQQQKESNND